MHTLVIDCATEACSVALFDGRDLVAGEWRLLGRGHAEALVPMIAALPGKGRADRIAVSLGPGSFTGVRVGLAAAKALALAWQADLVGYPTLALVGAMAQSRGADRVTVCMTGGHGEWFVQDFDPGVHAVAGVRSLTPLDAAAHACCAHIAGSKAAELAASLGNARFVPLEILPDAREFPLVPEHVLSRTVAPIYGRPPDARIPQSGTEGPRA